MSGIIDGRPCCLTVDTGADMTFIRRDIVSTKGLSPARQVMCGVTGHCQPVYGPVRVRIAVGGVVIGLPVYVTDLQEPGLLGLDYLRKAGARIDLQQGTLKVQHSEVYLLPAAEGEGETRRVKRRAGVNRTGRRGEPTGPRCQTLGRRAAPDEDADEGRVPEHLRALLEKSKKCLDPHQARRLRETLCNYADVFSRGDLDLGCTDLVRHTIDTGDARPIKHAPRRIPPARRQEMEKAVGDLLAQGVIERSSSPWSSAVVLVKKKDGTTRLCVDYRALNDVTVKDSYPLPRVDDTLDALVGSRWFTTLDLKSGYHQVKMAEEDKEKTAFSFGQGLWQFTVVPFGLSNAAPAFERLMERVLEGTQGKGTLVYLDDVIVYGRTFEEELQRLEEVLRRFRKANLKLSPKKCLLFQREVPFLGHVVSEAGVSTDPLKVKAVAEWPVPGTVSELRSFLGLCSYYRRYIANYSTIAAPLHHLTRKDARFCWDEECQSALERLKEALASAPVLPYPDPALPYIVDCDASAEGLGAVLSQVKEGRERVVAYYSAKMKPAEKNYCATRRELLAVVKSVGSFHPYLYGAKFTIRTDHAALRWLKTMKNPEGQLARWIGRLEQYDYTIEHRAGRAHNNADSLSRRPCEPECRHCSKRESETVCRHAQVRRAEPRGDTLLEEAQKEDPDLRPIVEWLEAGVSHPSEEEISAESPAARFYCKQWDTLRLDNGVLVKRWTSTDGGTSHWLTVIPRSMRLELVREMHGGVTSGHLGVRKTLSRLRQRFYWLEMRKDVKEWCRVCNVCNAKKGPARKGKAPLQVYQVGAPMERVAVDILGPLPLTSAGNRYICVAMDYFTKWPEAYALPNHEATTVAEVLVERFFSRFGVPGELHSDQGREFEAEVFRECCQLWGVKKTRTTPLRPQSDGMVERFNRTLGQELAKYCREGQTEWDRKLPALLMAYRSAEHEVTACTPARLMLGREIRLPVDLTTGRPPDEGLPTVATEYAVALQQRLVEAHTQVRNRLKLAGEAMRRRYDKGSRAVALEAGDKAWLHNPRRRKGLSPKLQSPWEGPYDVIEKISEVTFRIRRGRRGKCKIVHADRLWKYHGPGKFTWGDAPCDGSDDEDGGTTSAEDAAGGVNTEAAAGLPPPSGGRGRGLDSDDEEEAEDELPGVAAGLPHHGVRGCGPEAGTDADGTDSEGVEAERGETSGEGGDTLAMCACSPTSALPPPPRRPARNRRLPQHLRDYVLDEDSDSSIE